MQNSLRLLLIGLLITMAGLYHYTDKQAALYQQNLYPELTELLKDVSSWQSSTLRHHLSAEASAVITAQQLDTLISQYRPLGKLQSAEQLEFSKLMSVLSLVGPQRVNYSGPVTFIHGSADINITLIKQNNNWKIYNLNFSNVLTQ